jgi:hypothetical protein
VPDTFTKEQGAVVMQTQILQTCSEIAIGNISIIYFVD